MNHEIPNQESSVLDANLWISICRAFKTLDFELRPKLYNIAASNYPATHVYFWQKACEDRYGLLKHENLSLRDAAMRIIGVPFELKKSFELLDEYIKLLLNASSESDHVVFHANPVTQLSNHILICFNRKIWSRYSDPAVSFSIEDNLHANSLLDALIKVSLQELKKVEENENLRFDENTFVESELLVRAACNLLCSLSSDTEIESKTLASLFGNFVHISQIPYESRSSSGSVIVTNKKMPIDITFNSPIPLHDHLAARKIFEMSTHGISVITDGENVFGLMKYGKDFLEINGNEIEIKIYGYGHWDVNYNSGVLFEVKNGIPRLPRPKLSRTEFEKALQLFSDSSINNEELWAVVKAATHAQHGAIVIISSDSEVEAQRLNPQATKISPTILPTELLPSVFAIDGALLMGLDGMCYAVGVILDGEISKRGTKSRGSRYNSAVRYIDSRLGKAIALVVSEDGYVNLILPEKGA